MRLICIIKYYSKHKSVSVDYNNVVIMEIIIHSIMLSSVNSKYIMLSVVDGNS